MTEKLLLPRFSPVQIVGIGGFAGILLVIFTTWLTVQQPWLGIQIDYQPGQSTLKIAKVFKDSPSYNHLKPDDEILGFQVGENYITISPLYNMEEPALSPTYELYNEYIQKQTELHNLLLHKNVTIKLKNKNVIIQPQAKRPISSLPIVSYWLVIFIGFIALVIVLSIWSYQRGKIHIRILTTLGCGFFIGTSFNAVTLSKEVVLSGDLYHLLTSLCLLGVILFAVSIAALLWNYPKKLSNFPTTNLIYLFYPIIWINQTWQIIELPLHAYYFHFLITFAFIVLFAIRQWYQSRNSIKDKAAIQWLLLSITLSIGFAMIFYFIPLINSSKNIISVSVTYFAVFMTFIGLVLGIIKHNLFDISQMWNEIWIWVFNVCLLLLIDSILIILLDLTSGVAFALSAIIVSWIYFPVRKWFSINVLKFQSQTIDNYFPILMEELIAVESNKSFPDKWLDIVNRVFSPSDLAVNNCPCNEIKITNNGANLSIPSLDENKHIVLTYKDHGQKLFSKQDKVLSKNLYDLTKYTSNIKKAHEEGAQDERKRIARDLHDDIAAQILTIIHSSHDSKIIGLAQKTLASLRETIYSLDTNASINIQVMLERLYQLINNRINLAGLTLQWDVTTLAEPDNLNPRQHINLQHILQEVISNTIKHANASQASVFITINKNSLEIKVCDNGTCGNIDAWVAGKGLNNIKTRAKEINGTVHWYHNNNSGDNSSEQGCCVNIQCSL